MSRHKFPRKMKHPARGKAGYALTVERTNTGQLPVKVTFLRCFRILRDTLPSPTAVRFAAKRTISVKGGYAARLVGGEA